MKKGKFVENQSQTTHNSIQLWYETLNNSPSVNVSKLEMDINVWQIGNTNKKILMDFGLKTDNSTNIKKIFMYFPFTLKESNVLCLGKTFKSPEILQGIFNEDYSATPCKENPKYLLIKNEKNEIVFATYCFTVATDIEIQSIYGGTILSFHVNQSTHIQNLYFRFRITTDNYGAFIEHHRPKNSFFESAFVETEIFDFRINEKRNQDKNLIEEICKHKKFDITNINFFVMTSVNDEIISDGLNLIYKRQLETDGFWHDYLGQKYENMSVYKSNNVKIKGSIIEDFNCFVKINYRKSNAKTLIKYLLVLLVITVTFSVIANIISNIIWLGIKNFFGGI